MPHLQRKKQLLKRFGFRKTNLAKRTPQHKTKSHAVIAEVGHKVKLIRFGSKGVTGATDKKGKNFDRLRRNFRKRHAKNIRKGKMSAAWWANEVKWK